MMHMIPITSRFQPTPVFIDGLIRVQRKGKWYDQKMYCGGLARFKKIIERMERMGKIVEFTYSYGLGLEEEE
jgi:hypothetical protein